MSEQISARRSAINYIASTGPDVCWTPMGGGMVPVPYMSIAFLDPAFRISESVNDNSCKDFQLDSRATVSQGNDPGTGKGVVIHGWKGIAFAKTASSSVLSEGFALVRDGDPAWINRDKNDPGPTAPQTPAEPTTIEHW